MAYARNGIGMEIAADRHGCPPETGLWLAVVHEVISTESADDAERWLASKDGQMVAAMAGLDPGWLIDRVLPAANRQPARKSRRYPRRHLARARLSSAELLSARAARHEYFRTLGWMP